MTHSIDLIHPLDTIVLMKEGKIVAVDTYENLQDHPNLKEVIKVSDKNTKIANIS